ncbi:hypothetical protein Psi01_75690 [Planobispora siamensis]|uniref:Uncharacterized protein n=1 Tax=Planobispora siamensis TaxID=936338 RepID=A0A8J3SR89_9ACTN|nr:hypothetical protein Psi01_75690 [Planobispora siamensis]
MGLVPKPVTSVRAADEAGEAAASAVTSAATSPTAAAAAAMTVLLIPIRCPLLRPGRVRRRGSALPLENRLPKTGS